MRKPHGSFDWEWQGPLFLLRCRGTWNDECLQLLRNEFESLAKPGIPPSARWRMLSDCREWEGGTPEQFQAWLPWMQHLSVLGLQCFASIMPSHFHLKMTRHVESQMREFVAAETFLSVDDARKWLELYPLAEPSTGKSIPHSN